MIANPTERFSQRAESYRLYRPTYPLAIVPLLERDGVLTPGAAVADIAAGTGLLTEIFLARGYSVTAVEPNAPMRTACQSLTARYPALRCMAGTAEATTLAADSVDLITVAQAMHWFHLDATRAEFARILRPRGWCAIVYNHRRRTGDAFHEGYERILADFGIDYHAVQERHLLPKQLEAFFSPATPRQATFPNAQSLTLQALEGRILSSSYMPQPGHPRYAAMREATGHLFAAHQSGGCVTLHYDCSITYGQLG